jgi:hypothetical protein
MNILLSIIINALCNSGSHFNDQVQCIYIKLALNDARYELVLLAFVYSSRN